MSSPTASFPSYRFTRHDQDRRTTVLSARASMTAMTMTTPKTQTEMATASKPKPGQTTVSVSSHVVSRARRPLRPWLVITSGRPSDVTARIQHTSLAICHPMPNRVASQGQLSVLGHAPPGICSWYRSGRARTLSRLCLLPSCRELKPPWTRRVTTIAADVASGNPRRIPPMVTELPLM